MRRKRTFSVLGALTLIVAVSATGVAFGIGSDTQNGITQSLAGRFTPTKVPKKVTKNASAKGGAINVGVEISSADGRKPPPATLVDVLFDKDFFFNGLGPAAGSTTRAKTKFPTCTVAEITQLQAAAAKSQCKKALVSSDTGGPILAQSTSTNSAVATLGPGSNIPTVVTAFNGEPNGKNVVVLLHTDADPGGGTHITQVLVGEIINGGVNRAKAKAKTLRVTVPPLAGGAASIVRFESTIKATTGSGKNKLDYVSATCGDKVWDFGSKFTYNTDSAVNPFGVSTLAPTDSFPCKQK